MASSSRPAYLDRSRPKRASSSDRSSRSRTAHSTQARGTWHPVSTRGTWLHACSASASPQIDPSKRLSAETALLHPWLSDPASDAADGSIAMTLTTPSARTTPLPTPTRMKGLLDSGKLKKAWDRATEAGGVGSARVGSEVEAAREQARKRALKEIDDRSDPVPTVFLPAEVTKVGWRSSEDGASERSGSGAWLLRHCHASPGRRRLALTHLVPPTSPQPSNPELSPPLPPRTQRLRSEESTRSMSSGDNSPRLATKSSMEPATQAARTDPGPTKGKAEDEAEANGAS